MKYEVTYRTQEGHEMVGRYEDWQKALDGFHRMRRLGYRPLSVIRREEL